MPKTVLITGTSSGIGRATAFHFQEQGWNVIATMRSPEKETELGQRENVLVTRLDVTDAASIDAAVKAGLERFGRIDVLVNNAGFGAYGPLEATPFEKIEREFNTNVLGSLATTKAVLPELRVNKSGVIVNISSIGGRFAYPLGTLYHASKFAVEGYSEALWYEAAAIGVRVKIIEPGMVNTGFSAAVEFSNDEKLTDYQELVQKLGAGFQEAQKGACSAEDVARVVYQAATDGSEQLRYQVGEDAKAMIVLRQSADDGDFQARICDQFDLPEPKFERESQDA